MYLWRQILLQSNRGFIKEGLVKLTQNSSYCYKIKEKPPLILTFIPITLCQKSQQAAIHYKRIPIRITFSHLLIAHYKIQKCL